MKNIFLFALVITVAFLGCGESKQEKKYEVSQHELDSFQNTLKKNAINNVVSDAMANIKDAPVIVTSYKVVKAEYGNYRNVYLEYKNVSKKKVSAIKFRWYGENAFGDAADIGYNGIGGGFTEHPLSAGASNDGEWEVLSNNLKKLKSAWVSEVMFADGTKWETK